jgi:hypothetical protein
VSDGISTQGEDYIENELATLMVLTTTANDTSNMGGNKAAIRLSRSVVARC